MIIKLNSFLPLCLNTFGQRAIQIYNFPPFIDASCRREPDFQNPYPSISSLCRQEIFAPHLRPNHIVVYITVMGHYPPYSEAHHRLVAILQVLDTYSTHQQGQIEYSKLNLPIPSNCMISNNPPYDFDKTAGNFKTVKESKRFLKMTQAQQKIIGTRRLQHWDSNYLQRSQQWPSFVRTKTLYKNLTNPSPIFRQDFNLIFGQLPKTRQPKKIEVEEFQQLCKLVGVVSILKTLGIS